MAQAGGSSSPDGASSSVSSSRRLIWSRYGGREGSQVAGWCDYRVSETPDYSCWTALESPPNESSWLGLFCLAFPPKEITSRKLSTEGKRLSLSNWLPPWKSHWNKSSRLGLFCLVFPSNPRGKINEMKVKKGEDDSEIHGYSCLKCLENNSGMILVDSASLRLTPNSRKKNNLKTQVWKFNNNEKNPYTWVLIFTCFSIFLPYTNLCWRSSKNSTCIYQKPNIKVKTVYLSVYILPFC